MKTIYESVTTKKKLTRIRYLDNEITLKRKGLDPVSVTLDDNAAILKHGRVVIKVKATSHHKVKIKVKQILVAFGFKFDREIRNR